MADPITIAQTGVDPLTGSYLSPERRKAIFRSTRVSGFTGGGGGGETGKGSAIIVRPQTSLVDKTQNLQIQQTQQSVGAISPVLDVIRVNVRVLSDGINNLARQLLLAGQVEQKNLKDEQEAERKLNEKQIRQGKENLLERRITAALAKPILTLQQKIGGLFDRIMGAMTTLFFGWLTNQGIETLKAYTAGDSKKLEEIKNSLIKNILFAVGTFAAVNIGFGLLMRTITGLTLKLAGLTARIALAPFRAAGGLVSRIFGRGAAAAAPAVARAANAARVPITGDVNLMTRLVNLGRGGSAAARGAGNIGGRLLPGLNIALGGAATAYDLSQGNYGGAALSAVSMIPGPIGWIGLGGRFLYGAATGEFGGKDKPSTTPPAKTTPSTSRPAATPAPTPTPTPAAVQPQTPAISPSSMTFGVDTNNTLPQISTPSESSTPQTGPYGMVNFEGLQQKLQEKPKETPAATIQAPPKPQTPVGTLPEPKPNIIMASGGSNTSQTAPPVPQGPISDVPLIPSGNSDNFYVLYSQLNYNVVM